MDPVVMEPVEVTLAFIEMESDMSIAVIDNSR